MGRPVVHWEFWSEAPEKISDFYRTVFDWEIRPLPDMQYLLVDTAFARTPEEGASGPAMRHRTRGRGAFAIYSIIGFRASGFEPEALRADGDSLADEHWSLTI